MSITKAETIYVNGGSSFTRMPQHNAYPNGYIIIRDINGKHIMNISIEDFQEISDSFLDKSANG